MILIHTAGGRQLPWLVILLRLLHPRGLPPLGRAGLPVGIQFRPDDLKFCFQRMVRECGQLHVQPRHTDSRRILVTRAVRDKRLAGDIQTEFPLRARFSRFKSVLALYLNSLIQ